MAPRATRPGGSDANNAGTPSGSDVTTTQYPGSGFDYTAERSKATLVGPGAGARNERDLSLSGLAPETPKTERDFLVHYGAPGLKNFAGFIYEEYLPELAGKRGIDTYRKMSESDAVVWSVLFALEMLIRGVEWHFEPNDQYAKQKKKEQQALSKQKSDTLAAHKTAIQNAMLQGEVPPEPPDLSKFQPDPGEDDPAQQACEFLEQCLNDMEDTWPDTLSEILTFLTYGWEWSEICFKERRGRNPDDPLKNSKYNDGKIGWQKFSPRAQDTLYRWSYDDDGNLTGMWQIPPPDFQTRWVPRNKSLHFVTLKRKGNPEGRSVLRGAYRAWYFKQHIETLEAIGVERDLAGMPIVYAPPEYFSKSAPADQQALFSQLKDLAIKTKKDEQMGVVFPLAYDKDGHELFKFELLKTSGSGHIDTTKIIERYDTRIAMTVLADFVMLGHENTGTYALASSKTDLFKVAMSAWLDAICDEINQQAVTLLCDLNDIPEDCRPKLCHGDVSNADLAELGAYIQALSASGAPLFPNGPLMDFLLEAAGLPKPAPEDQMKVEQQQQDAADGVAALKQQAAQMQSGANGQGVRAPTDPKPASGQPSIDRNGQQVQRPPRMHQTQPAPAKTVDSQGPAADKPVQAPKTLSERYKTMHSYQALIDKADEEELHLFLEYLKQRTAAP